jgi:hypothetical protein
MYYVNKPLFWAMVVCNDAPSIGHQECPYDSSNITSNTNLCSINTNESMAQFKLSREVSSHYDLSVQKGCIGEWLAEKTYRAAPTKIQTPKDVNDCASRTLTEVLIYKPCTRSKMPNSLLANIESKTLLWNDTQSNQPSCFQT